MRGFDEWPGDTIPGAPRRETSGPRARAESSLRLANRKGHLCRASKQVPRLLSRHKHKVRRKRVSPSGDWRERDCVDAEVLRRPFGESSGPIDDEPMAFVGTCAGPGKRRVGNLDRRGKVGTLNRDPDGFALGEQKRWKAQQQPKTKPNCTRYSHTNVLGSWQTLASVVQSEKQWELLTASRSTGAAQTLQRWG